MFWDGHEFVNRVICQFCLNSHFGMDDHTSCTREIFQHPVHQWIGFKDHGFRRKSPYLSCENRWFPTFPISDFLLNQDPWHISYTTYHEIPTRYSTIPCIFPVSIFPTYHSKGVAATTDANWVPGRWFLFHRRKVKDGSRWAIWMNCIFYLLEKHGETLIHMFYHQLGSYRSHAWRMVTCTIHSERVVIFEWPSERETLVAN